jgi:hypothetical protein
MFRSWTLPSAPPALEPHPLPRCHPERSEGSAFRSPIRSPLDRGHRSPPTFPNSVNSAISVLKLPCNNSTPPAAALCLPASPPLRTHSNAHNPIPFMGLLHSSHHTPGWGSCLVTHCSPLATIPFRITSFAHPRPLTLIESHLCKKHRGVSALRLAVPFWDFRIQSHHERSEFCLPPVTSHNSSVTNYGSWPDALPSQREYRTVAEA